MHSRILASTGSIQKIIQSSLDYAITGSTRAILLDVLGCTLSPIVMTIIFIVRRKLLSKIEKAVSGEDYEILNIKSWKKSFQKPTEKRLHVSIARVGVSHF